MGKKKLKKRVSELEYTLAWLVRKMENQDNVTNDPQKPYGSTLPEKCHSVTEHEIPDLQAKIAEIFKEIRQLKSVDEHHFDMHYRGYKRLEKKIESFQINKPDTSQPKAVTKTEIDLLHAEVQGMKTRNYEQQKKVENRLSVLESALDFQPDIAQPKT